MTTYNNIGIDSKLDWKRIQKLLRIGLIAGIIVLIGDMLLGWGVSDESLSGIERELSPYLTLSDTRIFWSAFLGLIGIPLEGLSYFGIYRLMAEKSPQHAHIYRSGIIGYLIFGACGAQISAFIKEMTPYPKWCWIFSLPVGMLLAMLFKVFGNHAWVNAITAGWISIGNIWMFGGLLATMKLARKEEK